MNVWRTNLAPLRLGLSLWETQNKQELAWRLWIMPQPLSQYRPGHLQQQLPRLTLATCQLGASHCSQPEWRNEGRSSYLERSPNILPLSTWLLSLQAFDNLPLLPWKESGCVEVISHSSNLSLCKGIWCRLGEAQARFCKGPGRSVLRALTVVLGMFTWGPWPGSGWCSCFKGGTS